MRTTRSDSEILTAMEESDWPIPGWRENDWLPRWFATVFHANLINDVMDYREYVNDGSDNSRLIRQSFEYLLEQQPFSIQDWLKLTRWQFYTEGELYGYLLDVYNYYYLDSEVWPFPPDPNRRPPEEFWTDWTTLDEEP